MQSVGVSSAKELLLMASALKDNGSTSQWRKIRQRILQRDGHTCQACGMEGNSVDHIVPRHLFGEGNADNEANLQTLCVSCNSRKGGRFFNSTATPLTLPVLNSPQNGSRSHEND
jgi:5-methylcytosine-specific restriction endonuclease McrA